MKIQYFLFTTILLLSNSCQNRHNDNTHNQIHLLNLQLDETTLSGGESGDIDFSQIPRLSQKEYDSLQIKSIEDLDGYDSQDLSMGHILFDSEDGKIITIRIITEGELTEYLLSYDRHGSLTDKLLVAYEDLVENYSQISSNIKSDTITIRTVNYSYDEKNGEETEIADTIVSNYQITPELKFISF